MPVTPPRFRLNTFGGLTLFDSGRPLSGVRAQPRRLALMAVLARASDVGVSRDRLQALLWTDSSSDRARHSLNPLVHLQRRELGEKVISGDGTLRLDSSEVSSDLAGFLDGLATEDLDRAIAAYGGPFLDGFHLSGAAEFEQWVETERTTLGARAIGALSQLADRAAKDGRLEDVVRWRCRAWELDPLDTAAVVRLMEAEWEAGDVRAALQHARRHGELLQRLELPPDSSVESLAATLQARTTAPVRRRSESESTPTRTTAAPGLSIGVEVGDKQRGSRIPRRRILGAAAISLVALVVVIGFLPKRATLDPRAVLVAQFENRTTDSTLDPIGDIATDYIARGLAVTRLLHEVFDARLEAPSDGAVKDRGRRSRELAHRLGAGTVLLGRYYRASDSLHFEAQLVDASDGRILLSLDPVAGSVDSTAQLVELVRQRVMAGFGAAFGPGFEAWQARSIPPTYESYREILAGTNALWVFAYGRAAEHFGRAASLDPSYAGAMTALAYALARSGKCSSVDSLALVLKSRPDPLPPFEEGQLDVATATCRGDVEGIVRAARVISELAPRSVSSTALAAAKETELFRPREALALLKRFDPARSELSAPQLRVYWSFSAMAHHVLEDYAGQLRVARAGLSMTDGDVVRVEEAVALAALGRTREARKLADDWLADAREAHQLSPGQMATCVALQLRAHGSPTPARELLVDVRNWYVTAHEDPATAHDLPCVWNTLSVSYYAGAWDEASAQYQRLVASDTGNVTAHAGHGALALRRGDRQLAEQMDEWLSARPEPVAALGRARLAAIRGDREEAVTLLRLAFQKGLTGRTYLHVDPDLDSLRGYGPFQELVRVHD